MMDDLVCHEGAAVDPFMHHREIVCDPDLRRSSRAVTKKHS